VTIQGSIYRTIGYNYIMRHNEQMCVEIGPLNVQSIYIRGRLALVYSAEGRKSQTQPGHNHCEWLANAYHRYSPINNGQHVFGRMRQEQIEI